MTVAIEKETERDISCDYTDIAQQVIAAALNYEKFPYEAEVNLVLTDDEAIREINLLQRDIDKSTDVLSFPMLDYPQAGDYSEVERLADENCNPDTGEIVLGDIVISLEHVIAQAKEYGHSELREYAFLITHSMLHLFGYDHMTPEDAAIMENKQNAILNGLHISR